MHFCRVAPWQGLKPSPFLMWHFGTTKVVPCYKANAFNFTRVSMKLRWVGSLLHRSHIAFFANIPMHRAPEEPIQKPK